MNCLVGTEIIGGEEEDLEHMLLKESWHLGAEVEKFEEVVRYNFIRGLVYGRKESELYGADKSLSPLSDGFPATFFSSSDHLLLISSTGGNTIGRTECFFFMSLDPKILDGASANSSGVGKSRIFLTEASNCL